MDVLFPLPFLFSLDRPHAGLMSAPKKTTDSSSAFCPATLIKVGAAGAVGAVAALLLRKFMWGQSSSSSSSTASSSSSSAAATGTAPPVAGAGGAGSGTGYVWSEGMFWWHQGQVHTGSSFSRIDATKGIYLEPFKHWENAETKRR